MTDPLPTLRREAVLTDAPAASAILLQPALAQVAGAQASPVSLTLDYAQSGRPGEAVTVEAWVERATRSLVFVHGKLGRSGDGALLAQASAVFRKGMDAGAEA